MLCRGHAGWRCHPTYTRLQSSTLKTKWRPVRTRAATRAIPSTRSPAFRARHHCHHRPPSAHTCAFLCSQTTYKDLKQLPLQERVKRAKVHADKFQRELELAERKKSTHPSQILGLADTGELFHEQVLCRLSLDTLLHVPCVCRALWDAFKGGWQHTVAFAAEKLRCELAEKRAAETNSLIRLDLELQLETHEHRTRRFFFIFSEWDLPLGNPQATARELVRMHQLATRAGRNSYISIKDGVKRAMQIKLQCDNECRRLLDGMQSLKVAAVNVDKANQRLRNAAERMIAFQTQNCLRITLADMTTRRVIAQHFCAVPLHRELPVQIPDAFEADDIPFWGAFALK